MLTGDSFGRWLAIFLFLFFFLLRSALAADIQMSLLNGNDGNSWTGPLSKTWSARFALADVSPHIVNVNQNHLVAVADKLWRGITAWNEGQTRLIAVLYDPIDQEFWASTVPKGGRKFQMIDQAQAAAPAWYEQIKSLINTGNRKINTQFHAEDGVYFEWEALAAHRSRVADNKYQGGLMIIAYGTFDSSSNPRPVPVCGTSPNARDPSCMTVAENLGVTILDKSKGSGSTKRDVEEEPLPELNWAKREDKATTEHTSTDSAKTTKPLESRTTEKSTDKAVTSTVESHSPDKTAKSTSESHSSDKTAKSTSEPHSSDKTAKATSEPHSSDKTATSISEPHSSDKASSAAAKSSEKADKAESATHNSASSRRSSPVPTGSADASASAEEAAASSVDAPCSAGITAAACQSALVPALADGTLSISLLASDSEAPSSKMSKESHSVSKTADPSGTKKSTPTPVTSHHTTLITSASKASALSCYLQNEDPDQGINTRYCVCGSTTLPLMSIPSTAMETAACDYKTVTKDKTTSVSTGFHSTVTNTKLCQVCSQAEAFGDSCTTLPGCFPQTAQASVTVATSAVHVGTLTGSALYTSVSSALESICPPVTQTKSATECSGTASIGNIAYVEDDSLSEDGSLDVSVAWSSYNSTSLRNAMINSLSSSAMRSANSSSNCYKQSYTIEEMRKRDHPYPVEESIELCNTAELAQVNYYSQYWRTAPQPGPTDYIEVQYSFHLPPGGNFLCDFLDFLIDDLAIIEPEFAVGEIELGEAIDAVCEALDAGS